MYFVRINKDDANLSPALKFSQAVEYARRSSVLNEIGTAEIVVLIGNRPGDPLEIPPGYKVVSIFKRGRLVLGGKLAQYVSAKGIPPG